MPSLGVILRSHDIEKSLGAYETRSLQLHHVLSAPLKAAVVIPSSLRIHTGFPWLFSKDLFYGGTDAQIMPQERNIRFKMCGGRELPRACGIQECLRLSHLLIHPGIYPSDHFVAPLNYNSLVLQYIRRRIWYLLGMELCKGKTRLSLSNYSDLLDSSLDV